MKNLLLLAVLFSAWSYGETQRNYIEEVRDRYERSYGFGLSFLEPTDDFDYDKLVDLIQSNNAQSVEETLRLISEQYPASLEKYVVMYESRSLQQASPRNPRILALSGSKNMVFSFNGAQDQSGYNQLEVMDYDPEQKRFFFHEISFASGGNQPARFSQPNPSKCMNCHQGSWRKQPEQNDPRPNWEPYNTWPGAIGSLDGELRGHIYESHRFNNDNDRHLLEKGLQEAQYIVEFEEEVMPEHPRYKHLGNFTGPRFTLEFTKVMAMHNSHRLARIINSSPEVYEVVKPSLVLLTNTHCQYSFYRGFENDIKSPYSSERVYISQELNQMFAPFGVRTEDWSMDFQTNGRLGNTNGQDRLTNPHSVEPFLATALQSFDPVAFTQPAEDFNPMMSYSKGKAAKEQCEPYFQLAAETRPLYDELVEETVELPLELAVLRQPEPLLQRCVSCHSDDIAGSMGSAPYIPFDNPLALQVALSSPGYDRGTLLEEIKYRTGEYAHSRDRMPKGHVPTRDEVEELVQYLESL